jgi:hypothetical protein
VNNRHPAQRPALARLVDNLRQRFFGHPRIVLERQRFHAVAEVVVAHFAGEGHHRAVFIALGQPGYSSPTLKRAGLTTIRVCVMSAPVTGGKNATSSPLATGWSKGQRLVNRRQQLALFQRQRPAVAAAASC